MDSSTRTRDLLQSTIQFHTSLIELARGVAAFRSVLEFIVECVGFAETYLPHVGLGAWIDSSLIFGELANRSQALFNYTSDDPQGLVRALYDTSGSAATGTFSYLNDNFKFLEDNRSRQEFNRLALNYRGLLSGPQQQQDVSSFLAPLNSTAASKFDHALKNLQSLPQSEDPQGALLEMRSAIDIAVDSLIEMTPLTKRERGDLKNAALLPTIAQHLARDEFAKVDLILASEHFMKLKQQLAASKELKLPRLQAEALMNQAVALLKLIATTVNLPGPSSAAYV